MENTIEKLQKKVNRLEKNLHESKVQYKNVVNSLFVGIAIHVNNKIVFANRALIDLTGGNSETDFLGKNILEFVHPKDRVKVTEAVTKAFSKPDFTQNEVSNVIEGRLIKTDGSEIIAEFSAILINYYGKPALMVMINDITERKQAREVLKHRLITLTQPIGEVEKLKLTDIIDVDILQELQDGFAESYNVAALIYDNKGNPVTKPSNYSDFCSLIRSTEKGMQRCKKSKVNISNLIAGGSPVTDKCTVFKEVFEGATPIFLGDRYVGTWGIGQKLNKKIPEEKLRNFAKEIDIDEDEFVAAAGKLNSNKLFLS
ncbi:MAG: PocR ligand-binding domain-containing protein [Bacteroidales bacterium]|nr:PocR ligand-binding domain-containing protein [Bacteroidales bacterium]